ncbi:MAG: M23 family metallopeptidase [Anaerolineae bacterium]|nr:M23 family metallopeptidase [Anaerolineae bacterium]
MLKLLRRVPRWGCWLGLLLGVVIVAAGVYVGLRYFRGSDSNDYIERWFVDPASRSGLTTAMGRNACPDAAFILPSDGFVGLLWDDPARPYSGLRPHAGIDIFGDGAPGTVSVYAAYDGWLSRASDWMSSVIIRHDDPLQSGRIIWTYYTHMAARDGSQSFISSEFPAGTTEKAVSQGTLLGYQGEFAGAGAAPIGMHVHFSVVQSDAESSFKNEAAIENTLDPSPYLGMTLNLADSPPRPIRCQIAE